MNGETTGSFDWDACSKYVGGAEVAAWRALLAMEILDLEGGENANAAATFFVDLVEAFEKVQLNVVWHQATWFKFPKRL